MHFVHVHCTMYMSKCLNKLLYTELAASNPLCKLFIQRCFFIESLAELLAAGIYCISVYICRTLRHKVYSWFYTVLIKSLTASVSLKKGFFMKMLFMRPNLV